MIQEKINKLIPYISENFISYPLWEEGNYIPVVSFWAIVKNKESLASIEKTGSDIYDKGYELTFDKFNGHHVIYEFKLTPVWDYCENQSLGSFVVQKQNWSIEEMLDIISEFLIENKLSHE